MRMLKHGRLTSGGATLLDYFFSLLFRDQRTTLANVLMDPRGGPRRAGSIPCLVVPNVERASMRNSTDRV